MSVINTNITSLIAQGNLSRSQSALQTSMERLSSGLRINSAKDDAAGQAIANRMTAQITGLNQAQRNANDGISIAQTAEGSLNQINDNLQRIRELSVQAANDTNSPEDRQSIQDEINQRLEEINRISRETAFNGVKVLAEDQGLKIQVGANDNQSITVDLKEINAKTLGMSQFDVTSMVFSKDLSGSVTTLTEAVDPQWTEFTVDASGGAAFEAVIGEDNKLYVRQDDGTGTNVYYEATFDAVTGSITVGAEATGITDAEINEDATEFDTADGVVSVDLLDNDKIDAPEIELASVFMVNDPSGAPTSFYVEDTDGNFYDATLNALTGELAIDLSTSNDGTGYSPAGIAVSAQNVLEALATDAINADFSAVNSELSGTNTLHKVGDTSDYLIKNVVDGETTYYAAEVDQTTGAVTLKQNDDGEPLEVVVDPLASIDQALSTVDSLRSELGAVQNRFEDAIVNLRTNSTNLSAARSRIQDADYAVEVANMTRSQILQQAGTSVLAQANQIPQIALSLLG